VQNYRILNRIRTVEHIRTMRSVRINTGPGRHAAWPRLRETERIVKKEQRLPASLRLYQRQPVG
jgi:hypothetical protein